MSLRNCFDAFEGRLIIKIDHYVDVYEPHLARFRGTPVRLLEIGVHGGGSLELWQQYFGEAASIHGIDIDPKVRCNAPDGTTVHIGSQADAAFLTSVIREHGPFDIIIDDGSHLMEHQILTFQTAYPLMSENGVYICEDAFTSYWKEYGGSDGGAGTFMAYAKSLVDELHAFWRMDEDCEPSSFTWTTEGIHFYSGTIVFQRRPVTEPVYVGKHQGKTRRRPIQELKQMAAKNMAGSDGDT